MRIDRIFKKLQSMQVPDGVTAQELADLLGYSRANVSHELNKLTLSGKVKKVHGKPVRFFPAEPRQSENHPVSVLKSLNTESKDINKISILGKFSQDNPSLYAAIEQAKAAVLYPPNGMNILILGETGVGKSMFAELLYDFAKDNQLVKNDSNLIVFNCADYANNPQLLVSQLFGSKKGAYTGLDENRVGLIEKAHGGILFLDEVHRLPPEGQEMFFTFIDKGTFRRMGETDTLRQADVRIFAATTEKPESHLLRTFTRRFPMILRLPSLKERTFQERNNLVNFFINAEAQHLNAPIHVSANSLNAFMSYECENNIGQLRTDIKFSCANAYAEYISGKKPNISVVSRILPEHVKAALLENVEHRKVWNGYMPAKTSVSIYYPDQAFDYTGELPDNTVYDALHELFESSSPESMPELVDVENAITTFFRENYNHANKHSNYKIENLISGNILTLADDIITICESELHKNFRPEFKYALAKHIESTLERVKANKKIYHPNLNKIRVELPRLFNLALDSLRLIERQLEVTLPIDEAGFLAMILLYDEVSNRKDTHTKVIVVMHGEAAASSIAETANHLMGVNIAHGFNLPLDVKPQLITDNIIDFINSEEHISDVLLLVDMGSLTHIGNVIEEHTGIRTRTLQLVSTLHVIEAVQKSISGLKADDLYNEVLNVFSILDQATETIPSPGDAEQKLAILTICTSGEGSAKVLQNIIEESFSYRKNYLDVIPVEFTDAQQFVLEYEKIASTHIIIAAISPLELSLTVPVFNVNIVSTDAGINQLQQLIDIETTAQLMIEPLRSMLNNISPGDILPDIRYFIQQCAESLNISVTSNMIIGICMHMACLIDRLSSSKNNNPCKHMEKPDSPVNNILMNHIMPLCEKYSVVVNNAELDVIAKFFKQSNK
ncbi:TPA: sigma-54-dependent transcriptional regulator [Klebsiella pneumoniae]